MAVIVSLLFVSSHPIQAHGETQVVFKITVAPAPHLLPHQDPLGFSAEGWGCPSMYAPSLGGSQQIAVAHFPFSSLLEVWSAPLTGSWAIHMAVLGHEGVMMISHPKYSTSSTHVILV